MGGQKKEKRAKKLYVKPTDNKCCYWNNSWREKNTNDEKWMRMCLFCYNTNGAFVPWMDRPENIVELWFFWSCWRPWKTTKEILFIAYTLRCNGVGQQLFSQTWKQETCWKLVASRKSELRPNLCPVSALVFLSSGRNLLQHVVLMCRTYLTSCDRNKTKERRISSLYQLWRTYNHSSSN